MKNEIRFRGGVDEPRFTQWLSDLKQVGSNLLVTGEVPDEVSARASSRFFGRADRRFRVLALTDKAISNAEARLPDDAAFDDPTTWVIDQRCGERSVPTAAADVAADSDCLETSDARALCNEIQTAISFFDEQADGLAPAELRVGVDSLFPLVQEDLSATKRALRTLGATVRGVQGMAHYHLRVPHDDETVEELMPLFDARVELRKRPRHDPEQRWYATDLDAKTPWMEL